MEFRTAIIGVLGWKFGFEIDIGVSGSLGAVSVFLWLVANLITVMLLFFLPGETSHRVESIYESLIKFAIICFGSHV